MTPAQVKPEVAVSPARVVNFRRLLLLIAVATLATDIAGKLIAVGLAAISMAFVMASFEMSPQDLVDSFRSSVVGLFYEDALYTLPSVLVHSVIVVTLGQRWRRLGLLRKSIVIVLSSASVVFWATCLIYNIYVRPGFMTDEPFWAIGIVYFVAMAGALIGGWALGRAVAFLDRRDRDRLNHQKGWY